MTCDKTATRIATTLVVGILACATMVTLPACGESSDKDDATETVVLGTDSDNAGKDAGEDSDKGATEGVTEVTGESPDVASLHTDDTHIVLRLGEGTTFLVFDRDGNDIVGLTSYVDYGDAGIAQNVGMAGNDGGDVSRIEGTYVVTEHAASAYAGLTADTLLAAYPEATQV